MLWVITENVDASYSRLEDWLQPTAVIPAGVVFPVVVNKLKLSEEFETYQISFISQSLKTCLFKKFVTKPCMSQFRGWEIITLKRTGAVALCHARGFIPIERLYIKLLS